MRSRFFSVRFCSVRSKNWTHRFGFFRFGQKTEHVGSVFFGSVFFGSVLKLKISVRFEVGLVYKLMLQSRNGLKIDLVDAILGRNNWESLFLLIKTNYVKKCAISKRNKQFFRFGLARFGLPSIKTWFGLVRFGPYRHYMGSVWFGLYF